MKIKHVGIIFVLTACGHSPVNTPAVPTSSVSNTSSSDTTPPQCTLDQLKPGQCCPSGWEPGVCKLYVPSQAPYNPFDNESGSLKLN